MSDHNTPIEQLFQKYHSGKTTEEEESTLHKAILSDPETAKKFKDYDLHYISFQSETDESWNRLRKKLLSSSRTRINPFIHSLLRYAAIFLFAFCSFWYLNKQINTPKETAFYKTIVPKGQKTQLELPDGTKIWINSESVLKYPVNFNKKNRQVDLIEGEAYFKVAHDEQHPFIVKTKAYSIKVLGTEFNVMAYSDFRRTETTLVKGAVQILDKDHNPVYLLKPGERIGYHPSQKKFFVDQQNTRLETAWKDNVFVFEDIPFKELCLRLSRWYDVQVTLADTSLYSIRYTGKFKNAETIWQVLDIIKMTTPVDYKLTDRKLTIFKK